ncbi:MULTISPECIES: hypothetical protein [unclassified Moorena]|uniref:hypothetical protein n=1 Tax=unclassified Moorena TaxID=2683338 RepID=UPI00257A9B5F|nr:MULTISPECIES: hypothetical protein [unclassified Moorena]
MLTFALCQQMYLFQALPTLQELLSRLIVGWAVLTFFALCQQMYLFQALPTLQELPYFFSTAGKVSTETIQRYITDPHHG